MKGFNTQINFTGFIFILISAIFSGLVYVLIRKIGTHDHPGFIKNKNVQCVDVEIRKIQMDIVTAHTLINK